MSERSLEEELAELRRAVTAMRVALGQCLKERSDLSRKVDELRSMIAALMPGDDGRNR